MDSTHSYLVTYTTNAGSTAEVAERIGSHIRSAGHRVSVLPVREAKDLSPYSSVIVGGPMIVGFHRKALRFIKRNAKLLATKNLSVFMTAMKITVVEQNADPRITIDDRIAEDAPDPLHLTLSEKHTTIEHYTEPVLKRRDAVVATQVAILAGKLDYTKLRFPQNVFVMLVVGAKPGDKRNWDLIERWTDKIMKNGEKKHEQ